MKGLKIEHLDMLGPIVCHTVRPVVFKSGLWSIEVEKSWNHLFDMVAMLMKLGFEEPKRTRMSRYQSTSIFIQYFKRH